MNTCIEYMYRDAANYKKWQCVVIQGEFTKEQKKAIKNSLIDGAYFYPAQVGLPEEKFGGTYEDDPEWFEFLEENFELTTAAPNISITPKELVDNFLVASEGWGDPNHSNYAKKQPAVTVVLYNGVIDSVLTNVPGIDVTILDFDDDCGSKMEMLDSAINEAKADGQDSVCYFIDHLNHGSYEKEED